MNRNMAVVALALVLGTASTEAIQAQTQNRQRDLITREELVQSAQKHQDLEKAIRSLRPHFLRRPAGVRSMAGMGPAAVKLYIDGIKQTELGSLVLIQTLDVEEVRYLEPARAQEQYGITHSGGVIQVKRYRPGGSGGS
jgi:outer membrane receptor protein involved in Fe transport